LLAGASTVSVADKLLSSAVIMPKRNDTAKNPQV